MTQAYLEQVRHLFDHWAAGGYGEQMEKEYGPVARAAFEKMQIRPHQRFLDLGCGVGYACRWAADAGALAYGIDGSPRMIERAKLAAGKNPKVQFRRGFFPTDFLKSKSFDAIFAVESMYYMPDVTTALRSVHDLLTPGGTFACVLSYYWENEASHGWPHSSGVGMTMASEQQWADELGNVGLIVMARQRIYNGPGAGSLFLMARRRAG